MSEHSDRWEIDTAKILPEVFKYTTIVLSELLLPRVTLPTWQNSAFPAKSTGLDCVVTLCCLLINLTEVLSLGCLLLL